MSHMNTIDRSILRAATTKLVYMDTDRSHVIPKWAGLVHEYSTEHSVGFVMGVLNRVADIRARELADGHEPSESEEAGGQETN